MQVRHYQISLSSYQIENIKFRKMAGAERFELTTYGFGDRRSTS